MRIISILLSLIMTMSYSLETSALEKATRDVVNKNLAELDLKAEKISMSPVDGLLEVLTDKGIFYFSTNGRYIVHGKIYDLSNDATNITERKMSSIRAKGVRSFEESMIVFAAKKEKYRITVFTDYNNVYSRKLHSQIDAYNDLGITVRYLAFPAGGPANPTFDKMGGIWCAKNPHKELTEAMKDGKAWLNRPSNCSVPISEHHALGRKVGVSGTPAIILSDGSMIQSFQEPNRLLQSIIAIN